MVEDEHALAETVRRGLKNEGFVVDVAHDGVRGLAAALENAYDAILLDLMLPRMNGYEFLTALKEREGSIPHFIILSGYHDFSEDELRAAGVAKVLQKPVGMDDLKEAIEGN